MKLPSKARWKLIPRSDLLVERSAKPVVLELDAAVEWIKHNRPLLWVGSIFSVPEPSRFPSGYALTRSLFDLILPANEGVSDSHRDSLIDYLLPRWPLEALFDEFESLHFDLSESVLAFFADLDKQANPNPLHEAVTRYYQQGLSAVPLCVTTNWDSLIEKAFRGKGFTVHVGGPAEVPRDDFGKPGNGDKTMFVYHPHGSFETADVVCSSFQEQQQLSLNIGWKFHPMLLLGYSGYEPSLYRHLETSGPQLWCIRNERDLEIPAKRRLLSRRGTCVYVGDMLELLRELRLLNEDVSLTTSYLGLEGQIPPKVIEVIHCAIASKIEPQFCSHFLADAICSDYEEPELTFRLAKITRAIDNHIRNRVPSPELPLELMAIARFRNDEQLWLSFLAYLLRRSALPKSDTIERILGYADEARRQREAAGISEDVENIYKLSQSRVRCYRSFLGMSEREDDDARDLGHQVAWMALGDMALGAELTEVAAFSCLRLDEDDRARGYFDTAATFYYLTGLWNAGKLNEWACRNSDQLKEHAKRGTLRIPIPSSAADESIIA